AKYDAGQAKAARQAGCTPGCGRLSEEDAQPDRIRNLAGQGGNSDGVLMRRRQPWRRPKVLHAIFLILALVPVVLTLAYVVPSVRPVSTLMLRDLATGRQYQRQWVPLAEIAPVLVASVTMSEDGQFCAHRGIDLGALNEAFGEFLQG